MHPVLFHLGPVTLFSYGLLLALGFMAGVGWSLHEARRVGESPDFMLDLAFIGILLAIVGSRLGYVALSWPYFVQNPWEVFKIWQGGLVFYGGLAAALAGGIAYILAKGRKLLATGDLVAPGIALAQAIGRLGCLMAGCCYGRACELPWAVTFSDPHTLARPTNLPLHPTQAYASLSLFAIFLLLVLVRRRKAFAGQVFWTYAMLHGLARLVVEHFRGDYTGPPVLVGLTPTQTFALLLFCGSALVLGWLWVRHHRATR